jgi:hypothetical protein
MSRDAVPLDDLAGATTSRPRGAKPWGGLDLKTLVAVFAVFMLVVSDVFTDNVIAGFRGGVECRTPTAYGVVLQGIFLVIFYALANYMIRERIV